MNPSVRLIFLLSTILVPISDAVFGKFDAVLQARSELSSKLNDVAVRNRFNEAQADYVTDFYSTGSDPTNLLAFVTSHADATEIASVLSLLQSNQTLALIAALNTNCSKLNLTSAACEYDCNIYLNLITLFSLLEKNATLQLAKYFAYYSYSGSFMSAYDTGNYDMCRYSYGTYCYMPAEAYGMAIYQHGCCVPGTCTGEDAEKVVKQSGLCYQAWVHSYGWFVSNYIGGEVNTYCEEVPRHFDAGAILVILIFFIFLSLVCVASVFKQLFDLEKVDIIFDCTKVSELKENHNSKISTFVSIFCIQDSWANFSSFRKNKNLNFLDGIRWWSMCWVVLGHAFFFNLYMGLDNERTVLPVDGISPARDDFTYDINEFYTVFALQGFFSVDSFFWLSGFLGIWSLLKLVKQMEHVRYGYFLTFPTAYLIRLLRLAPMMIYVTLISWQLSDQFPEGPHVTSRDVNKSSCDDNWYKVFFFYANMSDDQAAESCMGHLWYVQCDMQIFLLLPLFAILYHVRPKVGILATFIAFLICCAIRLYEGFYYHFGENFIIPGVETINGGDEGSYSYFKPWTRMGTYFAGSLGMMMILSTHERFRLTKLQYWILSSSAAFILCSLTFWPYQDAVDAPGTRWNLEQNIWYYALSRPGWGVGLSVLAYAWRFGRRAEGPKNGKKDEKKAQEDEKRLLIGRNLMHSDEELEQEDDLEPLMWENYMLSKFLVSFEFYQPLAKLTYSMYLIHFIIYTWYLYELETSTTYSSWQVFYLFFGTLVFSFVAALLLWFVMERPLANMVQLLIARMLGSSNKSRAPGARGGAHGGARDAKEDDNFNIVHVEEEQHKEPMKEKIEKKGQQVKQKVKGKLSQISNAMQATKDGSKSNGARAGRREQKVGLLGADETAGGSYGDVELIEPGQSTGKSNE